MRGAPVGKAVLAVAAWAALAPVPSLAAGAQDGRAATGAPAPVSAGPEEMMVAIDIARTFVVPEGTATLVIGNPLVADATVQRNGVAVITGKSYGSTNVIALNARGETLREVMVYVQAKRNGLVTVMRGTQRFTYTCKPNCEPTLTLGDAQETFDVNNAQIGARNGASLGGAAPAPR